MLFKSLILGPSPPKYSKVLGFKQITFDYGFEKWKDGNIFTNQMRMNVTKDLWYLFVEELCDNVKYE